MKDKKLAQQEKPGVFDSPRNVTLVLRFLYSGCILLFMLDFVIHRHVIHQWENVWSFYSIYGFVSCVILVIIASWMRPFLIRDENYYDNEGLGAGDLENSKSTDEQVAIKTTSNDEIKTDSSHKTAIGGKHVDD
ncbi:MAG: hypothetical protein ACI9ES_002223 [Oceanospirillaceae bacterium]|jgi:hypothetical protein